MIRISHVEKTFKIKKQEVHALKNVSLHVKEGDIFGIVGYSGAGKSTLVRLVNGLEKPDEGTVVVDGKNILELNDKELNAIRKEIGMVFQQFNLLNTQTVFQNIAIPLIIGGYSKSKIEKRVNELLKFVELENKADVIVSQLSGGQKQRVGIARALATNPKILLCDEATSALDPNTTDSILNLLLKINEELNVTILLITHEMDVIRKICNKVAVMKSGEIIEEGETIQVFTKPKEKVTQNFIDTVVNHYIPKKILRNLTNDTKIIKLTFLDNNAESELIYEVNRYFNVRTSILSASVNELREDILGILILKISGSDDDLEKVIKYIESKDVLVERMYV